MGLSQIEAHAMNYFEYLLPLVFKSIHSVIDLFFLYTCWQIINITITLISMHTFHFLFHELPFFVYYLFYINLSCEIVNWILRIITIQLVFFSPFPLFSQISSFLLLQCPPNNFSYLVGTFLDILVDLLVKVPYKGTHEVKELNNSQ